MFKVTTIHPEGNMFSFQQRHLSQSISVAAPDDQSDDEDFVNPDCLQKITIQSIQYLLLQDMHFSLNLSCGLITQPRDC